MGQEAVTRPIERRRALRDTAVVYYSPLFSTHCQLSFCCHFLI